ncbi:hypothetical protein Scep_029541 [Stephania cephalantha]|uniref:Uncharacterized protein n=1 Tax=Stephania cephalantha TaxID=152367 RepID=A0AAP0HHQ8_9MAGN
MGTIEGVSGGVHMKEHRLDLRVTLEKKCIIYGMLYTIYDVDNDSMKAGELVIDVSLAYLISFLVNQQFFQLFTTLWTNG